MHTVNAYMPAGMFFRQTVESAWFVPPCPRCAVLPPAETEEDVVVQDGQKSFKARGGVKFGAVTAREAAPVEDEEAVDDGAGSGEEGKPKQKVGQDRTVLPVAAC